MKAGSPLSQQKGEGNGNPVSLLLWFGCSPKEGGGLYEELGEDFFDRLNEQRLTRHAVKRLERLGYKVNLERTAA